MTVITFYGGIDEIGGNKFLVEDKKTRVFLDFGMQMGKAGKYFSEFLQPRTLNGMGDYFEFGLLPKLSGLYRKDYSRHTKFEDDYKKETTFDGVLLTHAHVDHAAYIHFLRPEIPIYCTEATKLIMQGFEDTGSNEQYLAYKENFAVYENSEGGQSRAKKPDHREEIPRQINIFKPYQKFKLDSIEVEPIPVDHSLPGVCGFIIHTSKGSFGYTADLRFHGRRSAETQKFVEKCASSDLDKLLCEGTRINKTDSDTEQSVELQVSQAINAAQKLAVVSYPVRDLDRFLSIYNAAKQAGRTLAIDMKQAYLLQLFESSQDYSGIYPKLNDPLIRVFIPRKSWGLVDKDRTVFGDKIILEDYDKWERPFVFANNSVDYRDIAKNQKDYVMYCSDYKLQDLIDVRPEEGSTYIRSSTEPFDDEMVLDHDRVKRWLTHFGLIKSDKNWLVSHVSGHGAQDEIKAVVEGSEAKNLIPIHTQHSEYFENWHKGVQKVELGGNIEF